MAGSTKYKIIRQRIDLANTEASSDFEVTLNTLAEQGWRLHTLAVAPFGVGRFALETWVFIKTLT